MEPNLPKVGRSLPLKEWPAIDRELFSDTGTRRSLRGRPRRQANWSPEWRVSLRKFYGQWLAWLIDQGYLIADSAPESRMTEGRIAEYIEHLQQRLRPQSIETNIGALNSVIAAMAPTMDRAWLNEIYASLREAAREEGPLQHPLVSQDELYQLGFALMHDAEAKPGTPVEVAWRFRDGLMIALLAAVPVRRKNARGVVIGKNLVRDGDGVRFEFTAAETKDRSRLSQACPVRLVPMLDRYLEVYRPIMRALNVQASPEADQALWLSRKGEPLTASNFAWIVTSRTKAKFGFRIPPHRFRHTGATSMAIEGPEFVGVVSTVLGHEDPRMTERHYNMANGLEASRHYGEDLEAFLANLEQENLEDD